MDFNNNNSSAIIFIFGTNVLGCEEVILDTSNTSFDGFDAFTF